MKIDPKQVTIAFIVGALLGGCAVWKGVTPCGHPRWGEHGERGKHDAHKMMEKFSSRLGLTADQKAKISVIFEETRAKMDTMREEAKPKFEEIRKATHARIREILNPQQQAKFDTMEAEKEARFKKFGKDRHKGFGPIETPPAP